MNKKKHITIKTIDGNRYETDVVPQRIGRAGIDWLCFPVKDEVGTKYINIANIVSLTELEVDE